MVLRKLDADFKSFYALWKKGDQNARPPKFKGKKYFTTMSYNQSGFGIAEQKIDFSHKHPNQIELAFKIPGKFDFTGKNMKQVDLFRDKLTGDYYLSII